MMVFVDCLVIGYWLDACELQVVVFYFRAYCMKAGFWVCVWLLWVWL